MNCNSIPNNGLSDQQLAKAILTIVFKRRKLLEFGTSTQQPSIDALPDAEIKPHLTKIEHMVEQQQPIYMILPAYPGKSPNRDKTLGKLPDLSEKHSLDNLGELCKEISAIYSPGAKICIASDGYVFSDLVRIPDADVYQYTEAIKSYYNAKFPQHFEFFDIKDVYGPLQNLDAMREELMILWGESLTALTAKTRTDAATKAMYQGITRFMFEDFCGLIEFSQLSKTQIQKHAKQVAIRVIQRSNAWSALLAEQFPDYLRLSIHPQFRVSEKIGIKMADCEDNWRTPWHSVAVLENQQIRLKKRSTICENHHRLIFSQGLPCHYQPINYDQLNGLSNQY